MDKNKYSSADEALTLCAKDPDALEYLYITLYKSVCAVCYACNSSLEETKDAAQETFARLPYLSKKYKPGTNAKTYILAVARSTARELYRKARREKPGVPENAAGDDTVAGLESEIYVSQLLSRLDALIRCIQDSE